MSVTFTFSPIALWQALSFSLSREGNTYLSMISAFGSKSRDDEFTSLALSIFFTHGLSPPPFPRPALGKGLWCTPLSPVPPSGVLRDGVSSFFLEVLDRLTHGGVFLLQLHGVPEERLEPGGDNRSC
ncbi:unnamed protein product [Cuscuta epithymum]|uniref:Uncharacterized protein n=1 Tax=Cuscuta epithymum TaxID=186058 RepID=A0AAV0GAW3_9ASTE|nr:unnamed protein product [Cuscuta epithymum]